MNEISPTNMGCTVVLCGNTMEPPTTRKIKICSCDPFRVDIVIYKIFMRNYGKREDVTNYQQENMLLVCLPREVLLVTEADKHWSEATSAGNLITKFFHRFMQLRFDHGLMALIICFPFFPYVLLAAVARSWLLQWPARCYCFFIHFAWLLVLSAGCLEQTPQQIRRLATSHPNRTVRARDDRVHEEQV